MKPATIIAGAAVVLVIGLLAAMAGLFGSDPVDEPESPVVDAVEDAAAAADPVASKGPPTEPGPGHEQGQKLLPLLPWARLDLPLEPDAVIAWEEARRFMGRVVAVEGAIDRVDNRGRVCVLEFDAESKTAFTAVIFSSTYHDFLEPPDEVFAGRRVRITGRMGEYRGVPQIVIERPEQIRILEN